VRVLKRIALRTPEIVGSPWAFLTAILLTVMWLVVGAVVGFNTQWLLWPSALASVVTFLIVFSLQYTQNRDTRAIQLKLDEILHGTEGARSELVKLEMLSDDELRDLEQELLELRRRAAASLHRD